MFETAVLAQILCDLRSPIAKGEFERGESAEIFLIHFGATGDEQFYDVEVPAPRRFVQRCRSSVPVIDRGRIGFEQRAHFLDLTGRRCVLQLPRLRREDAKSDRRNPEI